MDRLLRKVADRITGGSVMQVRDALRLAIQSSVAGALVWVGMEWLDLPERFVGVLSAALVMKASIGSTLVAGKQRVIATFVGCSIGLACLFAIPHGFGTAVAIALSIGAVSLVAGFKPEWSYGIVGAIALAIGADKDLVDVARDRTLSIAFGVFVGIICALLIFPEKSSTRTERHLRLALGAVGDFLEEARSWIDPGEKEDPDKAIAAFGRQMGGARDSIEGVNLADDSKLREKIKWVDRLYTSVVILKRVGERAEDLGGGDEKVAERYISLVERVQGLVGKLSCSAPDARDGLSGMDSGLERLEDAVRENPEDDGIEEEQRTLAFAMKEVNDSMKRLVDLYGLQQEKKQVSGS